MDDTGFDLETRRGRLDEEDVRRSGVIYGLVEVGRLSSLSFETVVGTERRKESRGCRLGSSLGQPR